MSGEIIYLIFHVLSWTFIIVVGYEYYNHYAYPFTRYSCRLNLRVWIPYLSTTLILILSAIDIFLNYKIYIIFSFASLIAVVFLRSYGYFNISDRLATSAKSLDNYKDECSKSKDENLELESEISRLRAVLENLSTMVNDSDYS